MLFGVLIGLLSLSTGDALAAGVVHGIGDAGSAGPRRIPPVQERAEIARMFVAALAGYTILRLLHLGLRPLRVYPEPVILVENIVVVSAFSYVFAATTARIVRGANGPRTVKAALVASAAVFAGALVRTALAASWLPRLLIWDHDRVIQETTWGDAGFSLCIMVLALIVAEAARLLILRRSRRASPDGFLPCSPEIESTQIADAGPRHRRRERAAIASRTDL